jgi:hypothetical protein
MIQTFKCTFLLVDAFSHLFAVGIGRTTAMMDVKLVGAFKFELHSSILVIDNNLLNLPSGRNMNEARDKLQDLLSRRGLVSCVAKKSGFSGLGGNISFCLHRFWICTLQHL